MSSSGILVNRRMSLFLAVIYLPVGRGLTGNACLDNYNMPSACMSSYQYSPCHFYFHPQLQLTCYLTYDSTWLVLLMVFVEHCHEMRFAAQVQCPKFTKVHGHCVVDRDAAFAICAETPDCKYVLTTTNVEWNMKFSDAAMLGKEPLNSNSEWKSCELPATTRKFFIHFCLMYEHL